jgi:DNA helicase-2/ATP-dependent DNA helicase PcrA
MARAPIFNNGQLQAITHVEGPCVVLAGPGAGKTAVLTHRAAELVRDGVAPERILLLTFTRASAKEMLARAAAIEPSCERLDGGTFHALATKMVNRNAHLFGGEKPFTVIDPDDTKTIIKKLIEPLKQGDENWPREGLVQKVISFAANTQTSIAQTVARLCPEHGKLVDQFKTVRDEFLKYKLAKSLIDYDDALEYFAALLEDRDIGDKVRSRWDYVMIDEYQDTNSLQLKIVYGLAGKNGNVMVVGDPSQSIYGFRGSAPSTMLNFRDRFPGCRVIDLSMNYRSSAEIIDLVNIVDRRLDSGFERTLVPASENANRGKPIFYEVENEAAQAKQIANAILADKDNGGEVCDHAIIVRSTSFARVIEGEFASRRIPYRVVGGLKIDETAHVKDLLSLARVAVNHQHEPAWIRLLKRYKGIGDVAAAAIADKLIKAPSAADAARVLAKEEIERKANFEGLVPALKALLRPERDPDVALEEVIRIMEPFWSELKDWRDDWKERRRDFDAIAIVASQHRSLDSFLIAITLDYSIDKKKTTEVERQDERPVTISTIHGAKGLEWKCVHIPSLIRGHMPSIYADDRDEELRLLYVALSRAKHTLAIYKPMFNTKNEYSITSDFEAILRQGTEVLRIETKTAEGGPVHSMQRIDMASRLLGRE